jgi:hypothetical protein
MGKKIPCHKKKWIFLHTTLKHENKFDESTKGKKRKKPLNVQRLFFILHVNGNIE